MDVRVEKTIQERGHMFGLRNWVEEVRCRKSTVGLGVGREAA